MEATTEKSSNKVGFGRMMLWQSRPISLAANLLVVGFIMIYCTDTLQMPAALVGTLLMASKIVDGFTDLFAGFIVDKTNTKLGRGRPYEIAIVGVWLCTWLMFSCPPEFSLVAKSIWIFVMYAFVNSIFATFLNASNTVYMVRAFSKQAQYVSISSYGGIVVMLGAIIVNVSFPMLMAKMATSSQGWSTLLAIYAIPLGLIGLLRFFTIKETNKAVEVVSTGKIKLKEVIFVLKANPYIYIVALMLLVSNLVAGMGVAQYYYTYVVRDIAIMGPISLTAVVILPLAILFPPIIKRFSTTKLIIGGIIVGCSGYLVNFFAMDNITLLIIGEVLTGAGVVPISMLFPLMIIDCADYNEWKKLPRLEGSLTSLTSFATKLEAAFGTGIMGVMLSVAGFTGSTDTVPDSAVMMIRMFFSLIPMGLFLIIAIVLLFYKLDKLIPQVRKDNEARRNTLLHSEGNIVGNIDEKNFV